MVTIIWIYAKSSNEDTSSSNHQRFPLLWWDFMLWLWDRNFKRPSSQLDTDLKKKKTCGQQVIQNEKMYCICSCSSCHLGFLQQGPLHVMYLPLNTHHVPAQGVRRNTAISGWMLIVSIHSVAAGICSLTTWRKTETSPELLIPECPKPGWISQSNAANQLRCSTFLRFEISGIWLGQCYGRWKEGWHGCRETPMELWRVVFCETPLLGRLGTAGLENQNMPALTPGKHLYVLREILKAGNSSHHTTIQYRCILTS